MQAGSAAETPRAGSNAAQQVLRLLQMCGSVVRLLAAFRCQDALAALERLPRCHQNTGAATLSAACKSEMSGCLQPIQARPSSLVHRTLALSRCSCAAVELSVCRAISKQ